ncbi:MAG: single-stranded DNA-binding protein [Planctomycetota bacterium]|jgi:single-strand DNA-binding protein|nr:single-stranded DNA-binding protein [Planctomycetota bacterium]
MSSYNRVVLMGNLTRDPELRQTPSGRSVADLGLATNEKYKNQAGETVEKTCFVDIVTWGRQAENCSKYLSKGRPVLVEGRLQLDQWENKEGEKRSRLRVLADRVQFISTNRGASQSEPEAVAAGEHKDGDEMPF